MTAEDGGLRVKWRRKLVTPGWYFGTFEDK